MVDITRDVIKAMLQSDAEVRGKVEALARKVIVEFLSNDGVAEKIARSMAANMG